MYETVFLPFVVIVYCVYTAYTTDRMIKKGLEILDKDDYHRILYIV